MGTAIRKLLNIASEPFLPIGTPFGLDGFERFGNLGKEISYVLNEKNGFFCFEAALRFFPSATVDISWGVHEWNRRDLWKFEYFGLADKIFCFAEDIFGGQFCIVEDKIGYFNPETGDIELTSNAIEEWASRILEDYDLLTGYRFAHEWQTANGPLPSRSRLLPKKPFVLGGEYDLANLVEIDSVRVMKNLGNLAHQIHDLPDGSQIQFRIL